MAQWCRPSQLWRSLPPGHAPIFGEIHRFDPHTPLEETMEALHDLVKASKVRYVGASSMWAWQFAKAQQVAKEHGWTRFVSMQNHYSLAYREEKR